MTQPDFASTDRHPKLPDLDNWRAATWMTSLYEGLDYPAAAPWCAGAHLGWCLRQVERAGIDRMVLADFCAVPVDLIHRFADGGYASEAETPSGIVTGLRTLMEEAIRPVGPALEQAWNERLCAAGVDNDYVRSFSQKIWIKAACSKFQAGADVNAAGHRASSSIKEQSHD